MTPQDSLPETDHRREVEQAIRETRSAIAEALGYIQRQEDGPFTMTVALREIEARLDAVESEIVEMAYTLNDWKALAMSLKRQRNEAAHQRDTAMRAMKNNQT